MAEEEKKGESQNRITDKQRFSYIGFEVFPGKPKDLFKNDSEKQKLVDVVIEKRSKGDTLRESCTMVGDRVSMGEKIILTLSCLLIIGALFLPWYSAYNEIVEESKETVVQMTDSLTATGIETPVAGEGDGNAGTATAAGATPEQIVDEGPTEELLHSYVAKKKVHKEYYYLSGLGSLASLGSIGSMLFSSGFVLILTGVLMLVFTLSCIALPLYSLYGLFGIKGDRDKQALKIKKIVKLNWIPVLAFFFVFFFSFFGADYSFNAADVYQSLGDSYGVGTLFNSLSWGLFVSLTGFIIIAVKGIEI